MKTPKILACDFLSLKRYDPKVLPSAEQENLQKIGEEQASEQAKENRQKELDERKQERIEEQKQVGNRGCTGTVV